MQIGCFRDQIGPTCNTEMSSRSLLSDGDGPGGTSGSSRRCPGPRRHLGLADPAAGDPASNQMASRRHFRSRRSTRPCQVPRRSARDAGSRDVQCGRAGRQDAQAWRAAAPRGAGASAACAALAAASYACPEAFLGVPSRPNPAAGSSGQSQTCRCRRRLFPGSQDAVGTGGRTAAAGRIWPGDTWRARRARGRCTAKKALERGHLHATSECPDDGDGSPADYGSCRHLLTWPRRSLAAPITSILKLMKSSNVSPGP